MFRQRKHFYQNTKYTLAKEKFNKGKFFYKNIKLNSNKKNNTGDSQKHCKNNAGYFSQLRCCEGKYKNKLSPSFTDDI